MKKLKKYYKILLALCLSKLSKKTVAAGYYNFNNFGDLITPDILTHYGLRSVHCPSINRADLIGVGSLLQMIDDDYGNFILGSGLIKENKRKIKSNKILLVRGYKTSECLGIDTLVGDPGLLASEIYKDHISDSKEFDIGIIPHYVDANNAIIDSLITANHGKSISIINVQQSPSKVLNQISKCGFILSSSLHGLIFADSLGINNQWVKFSDKLIGGDFKFLDYYSCYGVTPEAISFQNNLDLSKIINAHNSINPDSINRIKNNIDEAYKQFVSMQLN